MNPAEPVDPPRQEIAVAVVERDGMFLIGRREAGAALAGFWPGPSPVLAALVFLLLALALAAADRRAENVAEAGA